MIQIQCPGCKTQFAVSERLAGRMVTCSVCGTIFAAKPSAGSDSGGAGDVIDVNAEVIHDDLETASADSKQGERPGAEVGPGPEHIDNRGATSKGGHGWKGFDPSCHQGGNASRVRTFYFEQRFNNGPNCCSFGCFGLAVIFGMLIYLVFRGLFG